MADAADSTPASGGQFALTVADLNTAVNHEPRVEDVRLAEALGMERPRNIRKLVERHREALERLGEVCSTVEQTSRQGGRPGRTFWLNKRQALYLCTKSETPRATETTIAMVEVFDAHLAARAAPLRPAPELPALVPFLAGPERLVSTLHLAQALRVRHTHVLRLADVLAAERPDLLGTHLRFATYLHENRRPYRCFHMDRVGFEALMARVPSSDHRAAALRDATLAGWPAEVEAPADPPASVATTAPAAPAVATPPRSDVPDAFAPRLDRDGFAVMRLAGEMLLVDLDRFDLGPADRAVRLHPDGTVSVGTVDARQTSQGDRRAMAETPARPLRPGSAARVQDTVRVVGTVIATQPAWSLDEEPRPHPRAAKPPRPRGALPTRAPRADLAVAEVCGTA